MPPKIEETVEKISNKNMTAFWAKVYQSHGVFLSQTSKDKLDAYRILKYAQALEELYKEMKKEVVKVVPPEDMKPKDDKNKTELNATSQNITGITNETTADKPDNITGVDVTEPPKKQKDVCSPAFILLSVLTFYYFFSINTKKESH